MIKGKNPRGGGGLTPKRIVGNQTHFVFESYWVGPSIWPSFIQIGEIACITPARSSHGHMFNDILKVPKNPSMATCRKTGLCWSCWPLHLSLHGNEADHKSFECLLKYRTSRNYNSLWRWNLVIYILIYNIIIKDYKYIRNDFYWGSGAGNAQFWVVKYKHALLKYYNIKVRSMPKR